MRLTYLKTLFVSCFVLITLLATAQNSPVEKNGDLKVDGRFLLNQKGEKIRLNGISFGWHNWWGRFYNNSTVTELAKNWNANIVRAAIGAHAGNGYDENPQYALECLDSVVNSAIKNGIYVLIDWHSHDNTLKNASEFFEIVSKKYGKYPNVLYEIWNEPVENSWNEIKSYAETIIPIIRKNDPNGIIIVGSTHWDQDIDVVADDPITGYDNIMYAVHFYAETHKKNYQDKMMYAINKNIPVFFTECAAMNHLGQGELDAESWNVWMKLAKENNLSVIMWDIADKDETCSMLIPNAPSEGLKWKESDIKPWGKMARNYLKSQNK